MGEIKEAFDNNLLRSCAMKILDSKSAKNPGLVRKFIEEAQINAQLDHPNIVPVYELGEYKNDLFFTMKQVRGCTLSEMIDELDGAHPSQEDLFSLLQIFLKVLDAVAFAHGHGVYHLDLKPTNIMVGNHGEVYLMDWGLSRLAKSTCELDSLERPKRKGRRYLETLSDCIQGTLPYMAPELFPDAAGDQRCVDARTDVFSLGCILYEILTLRPPYCHQSDEELERLARAGQVKHPQELVSWPLPRWLCNTTMKALSRHADDRHLSATEFKQDIERFLTSGWHYPRRKVAPGAIIVREGEQGQEAFIILKGRCQVTKQVAGKQVVIREMGQGEVFGETAILTNQPRMATVQALDEMYLAVVSPEFFQQTLGIGYWMGRFIQVLASRFRDLDSRLAHSMQEQLQQKIVQSALLALLQEGQDSQAGRIVSFSSLLRANSDLAADEIEKLLLDSGLFAIDTKADKLLLLS